MEKQAGAEMCQAQGKLGWARLVLGYIEKLAVAQKLFTKTAFNTHPPTTTHHTNFLVVVVVVLDLVGG